MKIIRGYRVSVTTILPSIIAGTIWGSAVWGLLFATWAHVFNFPSITWIATWLTCCILAEFATFRFILGGKCPKCGNAMSERTRRQSTINPYYSGDIECAYYYCSKCGYSE